jgi:hypothetical protein
MKLSMNVMIRIIFVAIGCNAKLNNQPVPEEVQSPGRYVMEDQGLGGVWETKTVV